LPTTVKGYSEPGELGEVPEKKKRGAVHTLKKALFANPADMR